MRCVFHPVATVGACLLALSPCAWSAETLTRVFYFAPPTVITLADNTSRVTVEGCAPDVRSALPVLPVQGATFAIPDGFEVETVTIKPLVENELPLPGPLEWGQPPRIPGAPPAPAIGPDAAVYAQTDSYPDLTLTAWRVDRCRDAALLSVPLYPVRYLPAAHRLLAAESLAVTVTLRPAPPLPPAPPPRLAQALGGTRRAMTPPAAFELSPETPCTYLVLSTSNLIHHAPGPWNLQALCEARTRSGYAPGLVTVEWVAAQYDGPDLPAKIRAFLQEAYAQWGIRDLLIVGTFDLIPARKLYISVTDILSTVTAEIPSDAIYYGCLDGPFDGNGNGRYGEITDGLNGKDVDLIAEIMVGRFPVATTDELAHMVRKTLRHESATAAELAPNAFLAEKVNFGSVVYATGFMEELRWGTNAYALVSMGYENSPYADAFDTTHMLYDSDLGLWNATDALNHLNRDYFSINHLGHGSA
ncbi:MAG TPA: C25 family cysteine peptidase, partial [Kiritimatiellia bacterium]|nr:C25 family cysteine peptidase [Kiritimatiellia bacterium]